MRRLASAMAAGLVLAAGVIATAAPAQAADTARCVSRSEFRTVKPMPRGEWRMIDVRRLFDTDGVRRPHRFSSVRVRQYRACNGDRVRLTYGYYHVWLVDKKRWLNR